MKNKSHKGLLKRVRITKTGLVKHRSTGHKHLRSGKGGKKLRQMRKDPLMSSPEAKRLQKLLFRRLRGRTQPRFAIQPSPSPAQSAELKAAKKAGTTATAAKPAAKAPAKSPVKSGTKTVAKK
ncbi:MAG: 50S ribosomal protein L35 [Phycisphaerales bacterium]|nr:50S ribosomal protein L35 [Phycisphaerales bacterium]